MVQSLKLGGSGQGHSGNQKPGAGIRRLNRLPIIIAIALTVTFLAVIFFGLTSRGLGCVDKRDSQISRGLIQGFFFGGGSLGLSERCERRCVGDH